MKTTQASIGLQGYIKVEVIDRAGNVIKERPWQKNLILDQGLNNLATHYITQIFEWCAAGTGTTWETKETLPTNNDYTSNGTGNLARTASAGGRPFTAADVGKLVKVNGGTDAGKECIITGFINDDNVSVRGVGNLALPSYTNQNLFLYATHRTGLETEAGPRTNAYSAVTGHNSTTNALATGKRTLQRTFVFAPLAEIKEVQGGWYTVSSSTGTGTATVTYTGPSGRQFTSADVGKYLYFPGFNAGALITAVPTSPGDVATVNDPADSLLYDGMSGTVDFYGYVKVGEVGFSHDGTAGNNLNIRVRLENGSGVSSPIMVKGPFPGTPSEQLRVTYKLEINVTPYAISGSIPSNINDPNDDMSTNKSGKHVIERMATSFINNDGTSNLSLATLEPAEAAHAGLSPKTDPLVTMSSGTQIDRGAGADFVPLEAEIYDPDSFEQYYTGTFGINDGNGTWYVLGLFDDDSASFPFCFRFDAKQVKNANLSLIVRFKKTWNRMLT